LKEAVPSGNAANQDDLAEIVGAAYLKFRPDLVSPTQSVTPRVTVELAVDLRRAADVLRSGRVDQLDGEERARIAGVADAIAAGLIELATGVQDGDDGRT
jgi:hypothetical protein